MFSVVFVWGLCVCVCVSVCHHANRLIYHQEIFTGARYGQRKMAAFRCTAARGRRYPLMGTGNYNAISNNMKLVHWPLMGGLLRLVQR